MGSLFDSQVYDARKRVPWAEIDLLQLAREAAMSGADADQKLPEAADTCLHGRRYYSGKNDFQLTVQYRGDVASRFWYTVEWTGEDGERHSVSAQEIDLCLWRVAISELNIRARIKRDTEIAASKESPIKLLLDCPNCKQRHVDEGEWAIKPHIKHRCQFCGHEWRPDYRYTVGVASIEEYLGIKKPDASESEV